MSEIVTLNGNETQALVDQHTEVINAALDWLWQLVNGEGSGAEPALAEQYNARLSAVAQAASGLKAEVLVYRHVVTMMRDQLVEMTMQRDHLAAEVSNPTVSLRAALERVAKLVAIQQDVNDQDARRFLDTLIGEGFDLSPYYNGEIQTLVADVARFCAIEAGEDVD